MAGVFTNLFGGVAGSKYGLRCTLLTSLVLQVSEIYFAIETVGTATFYVQERLVFNQSYIVDLSCVMYIVITYHYRVEEVPLQTRSIRRSLLSRQKSHPRCVDSSR